MNEVATFGCNRRCVVAAASRPAGPFFICFGPDGQNHEGPSTVRVTMQNGLLPQHTAKETTVIVESPNNGVCPVELAVFKAYVEKLLCWAASTA